MLTLFTYQTVGQRPQGEPEAGHTQNIHAHPSLATCTLHVHQGSQIDRNSQHSHVFLLPRVRKTVKTWMSILQLQPPQLRKEDEAYQ